MSFHDRIVHRFAAGITLGVIVMIAVMLAFKASDLMGVLYFIPFTAGPLFVSLAMALMLSRPAAQMTLAVGSLLYAVYFIWCYLSIFYWNVDPQSPIGLVFLGIISLPVMLVVWLIAGLLSWTGGRDANRRGGLPSETPQ